MVDSASIVEAATWETAAALATPASPDINGDGRVSRKDVRILQAALGSRCGRRRYNAAADLNGDCRVDRRDLAMVRRALGASTNRAPVAMADVLTLDEDTSSNVPVLANDSDPDNDALVVTSITPATKGVAQLGADGVVSYAAAANAHGGDSFTYTVSDGKGGTSTATVAVTIRPVNDAPTLTVSADAVKGRAPFSVGFVATGADVDGDVLSYLWQFGDGTSSPEAAPRHVFDAPGTFTVIVSASDATASVSQTFVVEVTAAGPPTFTAATFAGTGTHGEAGAGGAATAAELVWPRQVAALADGSVFIVDHARLARVDATGRLATIRRHAGGDRAPVIAVGPGDALFYLEADVAGTCGEEGQYATLRVRRLTADAADPIVAVVQRTEGLLGTCALGASLAVTPDGGFFVSSPTTVFRIEPGAAIPAWEMAAPGSAIRSLSARADNGVVAAGARLIHTISATGVAMLVAGTGNYGHSGDGGQALAADLASVSGVAVDAQGALTFLEFDLAEFAARVRRVEPSGLVRTIAGGVVGYGGDGGPAVDAAFSFFDAASVVVLADGRIVLADVENHRVRVLVPQH
jgi:hypothetical protein